MSGVEEGGKGFVCVCEIGCGREGGGVVVVVEGRREELRDLLDDPGLLHFDLVDDVFVHGV